MTIVNCNHSFSSQQLIMIKLQITLKSSKVERKQKKKKYLFIKKITQ